MIKRVLWRNAAFGIVLAGALPGCSLLSPHAYIEPADFDLEVPAPPVPVSRPAHIGAMGNLSGAGTRMLVRTAGGTLTGDEYNRWVLLPEQLLRRALAETFPAAAESKSERVEISAMLYRFEIDRERRLARLMVEYTLRSGNAESVTRHRFDAPVTGDDGRAAALAMSQALTASLRRLTGEVEKFASRKAVKP